MATLHWMLKICHMATYNWMPMLAMWHHFNGEGLAIFLIYHLIQWHKKANIDCWIVFHDCAK
jgi:hypothetical protein